MISGMRVSRSRVGWLVALAALSCVAVGSVGPAQGYVPTPPYLTCFNNGQAELALLENSLSPAVNTVVQVGAPVTFSGNSRVPVTFAVASSSALLSGPDIDSVLGTLQQGTSSYAFTSTTATTTPGVLVYWDASFSDATLNGCEGLTPTTYKTSVRTFTVVSSPPIEAEVVAKKQQEETGEAPAAGGLLLATTAVAVQDDRISLVELECLGSATCHDQLTLSAKIVRKVKGKKKPARTVRIGTASFSITGDEAKTVKVNLDAAGRALLSADHGRCSASLSLLDLAASLANTQTKTVQLVQQKAAKGKKR
jgi:hypothetical protein